MKEQSDPSDMKPSTEDDAVAKLVQFAGVRTAPTEFEMAAVKRAALDHWDQLLTKRRRRQRVRVLQIAATVVVAIGIGAWQMGLLAPGSVAVGTVELASNRLRMLDDEASTNLVAGDTVSSLRDLSTGPDGRAAIRLNSGIGVRLDRGTRLRVLAPERLSLQEGRIYIDTAGAETGIEIETRQGIARDIGTRFALVDQGDGVRIQVREGRVELQRGSSIWQADAGVELVLSSDGGVEQVPIVLYGTDWQWTLQASPTFALEGATLGEFLDWVSAETGWTVRLEVENRLATRSDRMHGSLEGLSIGESLDLVLAGSGLAHRIDDGVLSIRPR